MSYTFLPGSTLNIAVGASVYSINPEAFTVSQTYQETNFPMKTLQDRNMVSESLVQRRGTASFSFSYFLSDIHTDDGFIWSWFGLTNSSKKYTINPVMGSPIQNTIYLNTLEGKKIQVSGAVIETLELEIRHNAIAKVMVTGSASLVSVVNTVPAVTVSKTGGYIGNNFIKLTKGSTDVAGIVNNSLSLRKGIEWLDQPTIHSVEAGEMYVPTIPYQTDLSVAGRFTTVLTDNTITSTIDKLKIESGKLEIYLDNCSITERLDISQYLVKSMDFKLKPTSTLDSYINYI